MDFATEKLILQYITKPHYSDIKTYAGVAVTGLPGMTVANDHSAEGALFILVRSIIICPFANISVGFNPVVTDNFGMVLITFFSEITNIYGAYYFDYLIHASSIRINVSDARIGINVTYQYITLGE